MFEAIPPSTVCTAVTWLSPSDIAVGCANGFVAAWNIASAAESAPFVYQRIHRTYILDLNSAYPTYPHLLGSTSMDGDVRLVSLLDPEKDVTETGHMRLPPPQIPYFPLLQSFLSTDENDFVRMFTVRRFITTNVVIKCEGPISAMAAGSPWHPSILLGCTDGTVVATNPIRKVAHHKEKQLKLVWFVHEWAPGRKAGEPRVSRFRDGFSADNTNLLRNFSGDPRLVNGVMIKPIFDEGAHITALSWNPNQHCASWVGAGMGCGLVRVEDLAI